MTVCMYRDIHTLQPYITNYVYFKCTNFVLVLVSFASTFDSVRNVHSKVHTG